jgi:hypothetical protein
VIRWGLPDPVFYGHPWGGTAAQFDLMMGTGAIAGGWLR